MRDPGSRCRVVRRAAGAGLALTVGLGMSLTLPPPARAQLKPPVGQDGQISGLRSLSAPEKPLGFQLPPSLIGRINPQDQKALDSRETVLAGAEAIVAKSRAGNAEERGFAADYDAVVKGEAIESRDDELTGNWRCRSVQVDRLGVFSYSFFRCEIRKGASGIELRKPTGSQRKIGQLVRLDAKRLVYAGTIYYSDDPEPAGYGQGRVRNEVGVLAKVGPKRLRLEIVLASGRIELIELVR